MPQRFPHNHLVNDLQTSFHNSTTANSTEPNQAEHASPWFERDARPGIGLDIRRHEDIVRNHEPLKRNAASVIMRI
jgi:hypothetical protein